MALPKVVAVMITGKTTERYPMAINSVIAYQRQTYENRELVIINDNPQRLFATDCPGPAVRPLANHTDIVEIQVEPGRSLGALRNRGILEARKMGAELIVQWDDDDFAHAERLEYQVGYHLANPVPLVSIFRWEVHAHLMQGIAFANNGKESRVQGFAGTMMWPADARIRFPCKCKHEDTEFLIAMKATMPLRVLYNDPVMYMRFYHGHNTWSEKHVMNRKPGSRDLKDQELAYFNQIYGMYYKPIREVRTNDHTARTSE